MGRNSFYYHQKMLEKNDKYADIKALIKQIHHKHKGSYGYRRIAMHLNGKGVIINCKAVLRLMRNLGLKSIIRIKKYKSYRRKPGKTAPNILKRNF